MNRMRYYNIIDQQGQLNYPVGNNIHEAILYINRVMKTIISENLLDGIHELNIWCRGSSGSMLSALLADKLIAIGKNVEIIHVKKPNEKSHCNNVIPEYSYHIIIDDLIASGDTIRNIAVKMESRGINVINMLITSVGGISLKFAENYSKYILGPQHIPFPEIMLDSTIIPNGYSNYNELIKGVKKIKTTDLSKYCFKDYFKD